MAEHISKYSTECNNISFSFKDHNDNDGDFAINIYFNKPNTPDELCLRE